MPNMLEASFTLSDRNKIFFIEFASILTQFFVQIRGVWGLIFIPDMDSVAKQQTYTDHNLLTG